MKALRLAEVLLPLIAARAWAPWMTAPRHVARRRDLGRRVAAARHGAGSSSANAFERLFDDVQ